MHLVCVSISPRLDTIVRPFSWHNFPLRILTFNFDVTLQLKFFCSVDAYIRMIMVSVPPLDQLDQQRYPLDFKSWKDRVTELFDVSTAWRTRLENHKRRAGQLGGFKIKEFPSFSPPLSLATCARAFITRPPCWVPRDRKSFYCIPWTRSHACQLEARGTRSLTNMPPVNGLVIHDFLLHRLISCTCQSFLISCYLQLP